jgi:hypothetical protein
MRIEILLLLIYFTKQPAFAFLAKHCSLSLTRSLEFSRSASESSTGADPRARNSLRDRRKERRQRSIETDLQNAQLKLDNINKEMLSRQPNEQAPSYPIQSEGGPIFESDHVRFYGFDELFPKSHLGDKFDNSAELRSDIRTAARKDFFVPDETLSEEANNKLKDPRSTLMSNWRKPCKYSHLTEAFRKHGVELTGSEFIDKLTALCGNSPHVFGSWIDIVGIKDRYVAHSWHQDSGLEQCTVMVGFPVSNNYDGIGVFSHAFKLSHRLPAPANTNEPRLWMEESVDEKYIVRPVYRRGKEVMVYDDRDIFHSAPDFAHRESLWRFM